MTGLALDTLCVIIGEDEDSEGAPAKDEMGERFAEMFIKRGDQVSLVLGQLEEWEFGVRRPALRLLTGLLRHHPEDLQTSLLSDPAAVPRLLDLLQESREVLRNDAILMMCELTRGNPQIQKLVAFENAFQILLDIVTYEGERSIVVEDCLYCVLNLLKGNPSNQQLFREHSLIQHLGQLLKQLLHPDNEEEEAPPSEDDDRWAPQKIANVLLLFQVIRSLVSPTNSQQITLAAQKIIYQSGLLGEMCSVLLESGVPVEVLTEAIRTVAEAMRGFAAAQAYFAAIRAPSQPPKPLVLVLLLSMTNEKQPFALRCSVLYAFQSFLHQNRSGKEEIVATLLPSSGETEEVTAGHVLCSGLLSPDPLLVWLSAVALQHALLYEPKLKEQLLRVQLATSVGEGPVSLLEQVVGVLVRGGGRGRTQVRAGLLQLLAVWLAECPLAVAHFLSRGKRGDEHLGLLTSTASGANPSDGPDQSLQGLSAFVLGLCVLFNDDSVEKSNRAALSQLVERRVGREVAVERLDEVSRSEDYVRAAQRPYPTAKQPQDLLFDHEFTKLFKALEGDVRKTLSGRAEEASDQTSVIASYKELIKRQDAQIAQLTAQLKKTQPLQNGPSDEVLRLEAELAEKSRLLEAERSKAVQAPAAQAGDPSALVGEQARLAAEVEALRAQAEQRSGEARWYYDQMEQWRAYQVGQLGPDVAAATLAAQLKEVEGQLQWGWKAYEEQAGQLAGAQGAAAASEDRARAADAASAAWRERAETAEAQAHQAAAQNVATPRPARREGEGGLKAASGSAAEERLRAVREELESQKRETEDLLVLLADQDAKLREYRRRLRNAGQAVSEEEDDDEEDVNLR